MEISFTPESMTKTLTVTNREFLRNFRRWKEQLETKHLDKLFVRDNGNHFEFRLAKSGKRKQITWNEFLTWCEKEAPKLRINIKRIPLGFRF